MKFQTICVAAIFSGCTVGMREVRFNEMSSEPKVRWRNAELWVRTGSSKENSALLIYEIQGTVDQADKVILLKGLEAPGREFKDEFTLKLKDIDSAMVSHYRIYWVDPDDRRTELRIETK